MWKRAINYRMALTAERERSDFFFFSFLRGFHAVGNVHSMCSSVKGHYGTGVGSPSLVCRDYLTWELPSCGLADCPITAALPLTRWHTQAARSSVRLASICLPDCRASCQGDDKVAHEKISMEHEKRQKKKKRKKTKKQREPEENNPKGIKLQIKNQGWQAPSPTFSPGRLLYFAIAAIKPIDTCLRAQSTTVAGSAALASHSKITEFIHCFPASSTICFFLFFFVLRR